MTARGKGTSGDTVKNTIRLLPSGTHAAPQGYRALSRGSVGRHGGAARSGRLSLNVLPSPGVLTTSMRPP